MRKSRANRLTPLALALVLPLLHSSLARADEGESATSLGVAVAGFSVPDHDPVGAVLAFDYERGVTDLLWLRASAGGGAFEDQGAAAFATHASLGITYVLDVLRYVPHVDLGIGGIYMKGEDIEDPVQPLVELGLGMDMLTSRTRSYGVFARFESFLSRSAFFQVGLRMSWRSGFF